MQLGISLDDVKGFNLFKLYTRHRRYSTALVVILLLTALMLIPPSYTPDLENNRFNMEDNSVESRTARSHWVYNAMLKERVKLIRKFGPTPARIELFPKNKRPWLPYTVWDFFPAVFSCPHELQRLGNLGGGGKWVCGVSRIEKKRDCLVYSFGGASESSFERDLLLGTEHCKLYGYDLNSKSFGPEIPSNTSHRITFKPYGLEGGKRLPHLDLRYSLERLMALNGHEFIDILKVDLESEEFTSLAVLMEPYITSGKPLPFGQLLLEIHLWDKSFSQFLQWFEMLEAAGLRPFWTAPNLVYLNYNTDDHKPNLAHYSFLNVKGNNCFTKSSIDESLLTQ